MTRFLMPWWPYRNAWAEFKRALEHLENAPGERSLVSTWLLTMAGVLLCWQIYVPVHEFLHVGGCLAGGGSITTLEISPLYGGRLFARILPFVRAGGDYAGRLSGFDTHGSDWCYFLTVFAPYGLTILFGSILLGVAGRRRSPFLLGVALVIAAAPFISLSGDFLELGSIGITRLIREAGRLSGYQSFPDWSLFRSDDLFRLLDEIGSDPARFGIRGPIDWLWAGSVILASLLLGSVLAGITSELSRLWAKGVARLMARPNGESPLTSTANSATPASPGTAAESNVISA